MKRALQANQKISLGLLLIVVFGLFIRLVGLSWDNGSYLHPDERFLVMTASELRLPESFSQYLNPLISPLNPYNRGVTFFVYGHFPLIITKILATVLNLDNYSHFFYAGRALTIIVDTSVILAVFFLAKSIFKKHKNGQIIALFSALSYSLMVLPFQQAHFFTTDAFMNAFLVWALVFLLWSKKYWFFLLLSALSFSMAIGSKITAVYLLPILTIWLIFLNYKKGFRYLLKLGGLYVLSTYFGLRIVYPYLFASYNWFFPLPDPRFLENLKQLSSLGNSIFFPPGVQWLNTNWTLPFKNLVLYGLGPALSILTVLGIYFFWHQKNKLKKSGVVLLGSLLIWMFGFFVIQSCQLAKTMRYYLVLYPYIALFIGFSLFQLKRFFRVLLIIPALIWFIAFANIYSLPHSRISASTWLNFNLPSKSVIVAEYWDDPLPLNPQPEKDFRILQLDFYQPDSPNKWQRLAKILSRSDYLVLSSNRLYGSIPRVPEVYPITSQYYKKLLNQELGYELVAKFTVFPHLKVGPLSLEFNDETAEEAFTVYDHPQVLVFKRQHFNADKFLKKIGL